MSGGRGDFRRRRHAFMAERTKYEWADRCLELEEALKKILYGATHQGAHTGMSWKQVELIAEAALAGEKEEVLDWEKIWKRQ